VLCDTPLSRHTHCLDVVMTHHTLAPLRYSLTEVGKLLGLSRSTLYTRIAEGKLAIQKDGRRTFILATELQRYLERPPP
jgi:excisionase family DNA binding protein